MKKNNHTEKIRPVAVSFDSVTADFTKEDWQAVENEKKYYKLTYYLKLDYTIRLKKNVDGSYFVEVVELPGCFSEADSKQEALTMIEDAKKVWVEAALERGISIPLPMQHKGGIT